jgi:type III restriction enzyme
MKLHFEPDLDYQRDAIEAVCALFRGQEVCRTEFTVTRETRAPEALLLPGHEVELGIGNRLRLLDDQVLTNLRGVQLHNGVPPSESLKLDDLNFTVEMETGTGKTYVYLRTIFELHRRYGFSKFVIVVPSVAIREGVHHTLEVTEEHFRALYANVPYRYFTYDSSRLSEVRNFATSPHIEIMVVTVGAINKKDFANIYKTTEKLSEGTPMELIQRTRPIVIVDEPQSVDGGAEGSGKKALAEMHPLCTLRYSATHVAKHHMVFRLNAVDAYERKLVKQIEVASMMVLGGHNKAYVKLLAKPTNKKGVWSAKVEIDVQDRTEVRRTEKVVRLEDDLAQVTGRAIYEGMVVDEMSTSAIELRGQEPLTVGQAIGGVDDGAVARLMIRRTIEEHLDKELRLRPKGIKVLSLFFIDAVGRYRTYGAAGESEGGKGPYAVVFEEEYAAAIKKPKYNTLFKDVDTSTLPEAVHGGYFSKDKKSKHWTDTEESNQAGRDGAADAYNLIMKDKEKLLSLDTKLKFIFSHSALKEGWDNPNVFQICALREMGSERERRQTIGRGLRLCVNKDGDRVRGFETNTLTVIATESYEDFAENLQREIERDTGIRFGVVEEHQFAAIVVPGADGTKKPLGFDASKKLWSALKEAKLLDEKGKVQDTLRLALKNETVPLPAEFEPMRAQVVEVLRKLAGRLEVKNADEKKPVKTRRAVLDSEDFKKLWDRIKDKTTYRVHFDNAKLIEDCAKALRETPAVARARIQTKKAELSIDKSGIGTKEISASAPTTIDEGDIVWPDLITELQDRTALTRKSIVDILMRSGRLEDFRRNPQQFIQQAAEAISRQKELVVVHGIRYQRIGDGHYYAQELFEQNELQGYLSNMVEDKNAKCVYDQVICDSTVEREFAEELENNKAVKVFAKLPPWFKVPTPLGTYNPDWAVLVEVEGKERVYFVVETKGSLYADALREKESRKMDCGEAHFKALGVHESPARYLRATQFDDVMNNVMATHESVQGDDASASLPR